MVVKLSDIVSVRDVSKIYEMGNVDFHALRNVDLSIAPSEKLSIMGPSGSGKSTLLHLIGCLDRPTDGQILIDGIDTSALGDSELAEIRREKIGFVFQFFYLIPTLTALENVELPMTFAGLGVRQKRDRARELLKLVNLANRVDHRPSELSGGERQRVAIARSIANDPKILLADEPTGNLDSASGREVIDLLLRLNEEKGLTLIIVTHDPYIADRAENTVQLKDGQILKGKRRSA